MNMILKLFDYSIELTKNVGAQWSEKIVVLKFIEDTG